MSKPPRTLEDDPLGYDTSGDFDSLARRMADDALSGRHEAAVEAELAALRERFGGGNVFADLGLPDPAVLLAKADAALAIGTAIRERGLSIEEAAAVAGMEPDRLLAIVEEGRTEGVSLERLDKLYEAIEAHGNGRKP